MTTYANNHVKNLHQYKSILGGRIDTLWIDFDELNSRFVRTHWPETYIDGKVTMGFQFETPRGPIEITDYWWNKIGFEWSVRSQDPRSVIWLVKFLRGIGVPFSRGKHKEKKGDVQELPQ
jgi:hypothetical protein